MLKHCFLRIMPLVPAIMTCAVFFSCKTEKKEVAIEKYPFATPEQVGMVADSLNKIETLVRSYVAAKKYPGAVTLIAKNGKIIYESEVGWSDSTRTEPYRKDHLFRMASMTKPIVSVAALQLVEAGKLQLDDPVGQYIPSFMETEVLQEFNPADTTWTSTPSQSAPTIRQLLTHSAGVPYGFANPSVNGAILAKNGIPDLATHLPMTIEETATKLGNLPLVHEPGAKWVYGLNTDVLGRVVEVVSGMALDDYIREHITHPLGIEQLDFYFPDSLTYKLATPHITTKEGTITPIPEMGPLYSANYPTEGAKTYMSGGSGMTGTARDYFLFCQALLNNGNLNNTEILQPETAKSMHVNQLDTISYPWGAGGFGYGFYVAKDHPNKPDGTYGWSGAFSTTFWIDPKNELVVVQLRQVLQSPYNQEMEGKLAQIVYSALKK